MATLFGVGIRPGDLELLTLKTLRRGVEEQDLQRIAEAATLSAQAHQTILFNPLLVKTIARGKEIGAVGICRAHSGTVLDLLFNPAMFDEQAILSFLRKHVFASIHLWLSQLTGGGPRITIPISKLQEEMTR